MRARRRKRPGIKGRVFLPLLAVAAFAGFALWDQRKEGLRWQQMEAEREALEAVQRDKLAVATFDTVYEQCSKMWGEVLGIYWEPSALVWTREGLTGYFLEGVDESSLRQVLCDAAGTRRGPRVVRPLVELLPAEMPAAPAIDAGMTEGSSPEGNTDLESGGIRSVLRRFEGAKLEGGLIAVELLVHPLTHQALIRRWRGLEGGAGAEVEPADAPPFPLLVTGEQFPLAPWVELPPLREPARSRWIEQTEQAFARIAEVLPEKATISELTITADKIEITVAGSIPAFEGKPPAPFGRLDLDEYGVAEQSWWYPYEQAGFGCVRGRPLAEVKAALQKAQARFAGGKPQQGWYSCSPAFTDGKRGVWHLT